jgi:hypothetical protein
MGAPQKVQSVRRANPGQESEEICNPTFWMPGFRGTIRKICFAIAVNTAGLKNMMGSREKSYSMSTGGVIYLSTV